MRPHVVLVGLMGSGKTPIGDRVAARLGRRFHDGDRVLEARAGVDAATLAEREGTEALHLAEASVLLDLLDGEEPAVLAPAASVIEDERCRRELAARAVVVWLRAGIGALAERARDRDNRPLDGDVESQLRDQARRREPLLADAADLVVDTTDLDDVDAIADHVAALLPPRVAGGSGGSATA